MTGIVLAGVAGVEREGRVKTAANCNSGKLVSQRYKKYIRVLTISLLPFPFDVKCV